MSYLTKSPVAKSITTLVLSFLSLGVLIGQNMFHVMIQKPASTKSKDFLITYDNGLISKNVKDSFMAGKLNISDKFYAAFAVLKITYSDSSVSYNDEYFIGVKPALISFSSKADFVADGHFKHSKLSNAIEITQSDMSKKRIEFEKDESNDMNQFVERHKGSIWKSDSLKTVFNEKWNKINEKNMDFVKLYGTEYYSFWLFKTQILIKTLSDENADSNDFKQLLNLFIRSFPVAFKESGEGKNIQQLLKDRIDLQKDRAAPNFKIKDVEGNTIRLNDFKGKFVLLDFWATWCAPCMAELPFIQKIRADYPATQLALISISGDVSYTNFEKAIEENNMNWTHIYGENKIAKEFGVTVYPTILLINKEGVLVFDGRVETKDKLIQLLKEM
jgi:thiol-disulfide isomerase/thioredoxin